jgi:hypothetical protein
VEHGKFLCKKAQLLDMNNQKDLARDAFQRAESIAKEIKAQPESELYSLIKFTRRIIQ